MSRYTWLQMLALILAGTQPVRASVYNVIDLGTLGGTSSEPLGINNSGQIVGYATTPSNVATHAALWTNSTSPAIDLGTLPGGGYSIASGINASGQIVGQSSNILTNYHAVSWTNRFTTAIDLGTLGGSIGAAGGVNDSGQIVGSAYTVNNATSLGTFWTNITSSAVRLTNRSGLQEAIPMPHSGWGPLKSWLSLCRAREPAK